jgi:hypothetical protein
MGCVTTDWKLELASVEPTMHMPAMTTIRRLAESFFSASFSSVVLMQLAPEKSVMNAA